MSRHLFRCGLAAALFSLAPLTQAAAEPRALQKVGDETRVAHPRHQAIAAFRRRHGARAATGHHHGRAHAMRVSAHRRFARAPYGGFRPRTAYARPSLRRAAFAAFPRHRHRLAYRSGYGHLTYRVSYVPADRIYAPVYGATIAGPSPSLPLYNRPSCYCH